MEILTQLAHGAIALLIAALAIYLALRLLGKLAKFVIVLVVIAAVVWFCLSNDTVLQYIKDLLHLIPAFAGRA